MDTNYVVKHYDLEKKEVVLEGYKTLKKAKLRKDELTKEGHRTFLLTNCKLSNAEFN
jgi:hypothetical protein